MGNEISAGRRVSMNTSEWGQEVITIASTSGQGSDQRCKSCYVYAPSTNTGTVYMNAGSAADSNDAPLIQDCPLLLPIANTEQLYFSGTNDDVVVIIWFD